MKPENPRPQPQLTHINLPLTNSIFILWAFKGCGKKKKIQKLIDIYPPASGVQTKLFLILFYFIFKVSSTSKQISAYICTHCILSIAYNLKLSGLLYYLYTETMSTQWPLFTLPCFHSCRMSYSETLKYSSAEGFHCMFRLLALPLSLAEVVFVFYYFYVCLKKVKSLLLLFLS